MSRSNVHSRFVPREEIDGVSAWKFSSMDDDEELPPAPVLPERDPVEDGSAQEALEAAYNEGFARGQETGAQETHQAMEAEFQKSLDEAAVRVGQLLHNMTDQLLSSEQMIARQVLDLACDLARQVVRQELKTNTQHLRAVVGEALEMMIDDGLPATVHMHPDDLATMQAAMLATLGENAPEFVADPSLTPGGCIVKSPSSTVDATIEKRWTRAMGNLGLDTEWKAEAGDV